MPDVTPPDYSTAVGQLRLLISDTEELGDPSNPLLPAEFIFHDEAIEGFLVVSNGNILRAASRALKAMAASEAIISKVIRTEDLSTNGAAVATALRALAKDYSDEADAADDLAAEDEGFMLVDMYSPIQDGWRRYC